MSYSTFTLACTMANWLSFACTASNAGPLAGDEVVLVYHAAGADIRARVGHPCPLKALVQFERVTVPVGGSVPVVFALDASAYFLTNSTGDKVLYKGTHVVSFSQGNGPDVEFTVTV